MSDYYKSLISDEEVIQELIKESKRREGTLPTEATRLKPNLNFLQRTVNSLISNNTRIDKSQDTFKTEYLKDCNLQKPETSDDCPNQYPLKRSQVDFAFEREMVLRTQINFVKSSETYSDSLVGRKKKIEIKKISFIRGPTSTTNTKNSRVCNTVKNKNAHKIHPTQDNVSDECDSGEANNLLLLISDDEEKTSCKGFSNIRKKNLTEANKKCEKNFTICISSDESTVEIISSDSDVKAKSTKNKVKTKSKKRQKKELEELSDEELTKKSKKKKNKNSDKSKK